MLLAYGILRRYWHDLDPAIQQTIRTLEAFEDAPRKPLDPPLDNFDYVMDLFLEPFDRGRAYSETTMAMWLVGGWWPEVKSVWADKELPESWRLLFHDIFGNPFRPLPSLDPRASCNYVPDPVRICSMNRSSQPHARRLITMLSRP
jgi:hypothetical protein